MTVVFVLIICNMFSTIYIVNYIKRYDNQLTSTGRFLLIPDKIISFFFNWLGIIPLTQGLMIILMTKQDETQTQ